MRRVNKTYVHVLLMLFGLKWTQREHLKSFVILAVNAYKSSEANNTLFTHFSHRKCHTEHDNWELKATHQHINIQRARLCAFGIWHSRGAFTKITTLICSVYLCVCVFVYAEWAIANWIGQMGVRAHSLARIHLYTHWDKHQTLNGMGKWKSVSWNVFATAEEEVRWSVKIDTL